MLNDELQYPFGMILILSRSSTLSLKLLFLSTKEVLVMRRGWPPDIPLAGSFDGAYSGTSRTPSPTQQIQCFPDKDKRGTVKLQIRYNPQPRWLGSPLKGGTRVLSEFGGFP